MFSTKNVEQAFGMVSDLFKNILQIYHLPGVSLMMSHYIGNKGWLFPYFDENGRRTQTFPIEIKPDRDQLYQIFYSNDIYSKARDKSGQYFTEDPAYNADKLMNRIWATLEPFSAEELINNRLDQDHFVTSEKKYPEKIKFLSGMKISKVLRERLIDLEYGYSDTQLEFAVWIYSYFLSKIKINQTELTITLSIHPLDYLLASAHRQFKSCYNIFGNYAQKNDTDGFQGLHKTAVISFMLDNCTMIGYQHTEEKCLNDMLDRFGLHTVDMPHNWPYKAWRQWVFIDTANKAMMFGREYPQEQTQNNSLVRKMGAYLLKDICNLDSPLRWTMHALDCNVLNSEEETVSDTYEHYIYEYASWCYSDMPTSMIRLEGDSPDINCGVEDIPCPVCGHWREGDPDSDDDAIHICCDDCEPSFVECRDCQKRIREDDARLYNGRWYCEDCYADKFFTCAECDEEFSKDEMHVDPDGHSLCHHCYVKHYRACDHCGRAIPKDDAVPTDDEWYYCEQCAKTYTFICDRCGERHRTRYAVHIDEETFCQNCTKRCWNCGDRHLPEQLNNIDGHDLCFDCSCVEENEQEAM